MAKNSVKTTLRSIMKELFLRKPSIIGLFVAANFAGSSLTPSLMPRTWLMQGIATGISIICGYALGVAGVWVWRYLHLPELKSGTVRTRLIISFALFNAASIALLLGRTGTWQNQVRELVGVDASTSTNPIRITLLALTIWAITLLMGRIIRILARFITEQLQRIMPRCVAVVFAGLFLLWLLGSAATGTLRSAGLRVANNVFSVADRGVKEGSEKPSSPLRSAGPESLVTWEQLGIQGKQFVSTGPSQADIQSTTPRPAKEPIRIYTSLQNGETHSERAELALQELIRTDAFSRKYLLLTTTTGTGYLDPNAVDTFEYAGAGDTAIVGMQYSYLPSWLALLSDTETPKEAAVALFNAIHGHWQTLDENTRPKLYLYGLSLGAYGSQASISRVELLNDPVDGALWAGPPFVSEFWNRITDNRDAGSPTYLPTYQRGEVIRFTDGEKSLTHGYDTAWQDNRIIYLQYPTDPVVFFSNDYIFKSPEWLNEERGRGVSADFDWRPFVTYFQLAFDLANAGSSAEGYGHLYSSEDYLQSWAALLDIPVDIPAIEQRLQN